MKKIDELFATRSGHSHSADATQVGSGSSHSFHQTTERIQRAGCAAYTHRTAIGNERFRPTDEGEVAFTVRANDKGGKRLHRMDGAEFVRCFLLHVLSSGVKRIRHYGVLASACKGK